MNRRIVLIDQNEVQNVMSFYGCGLGNEIYTIQSLQSLNEEDLKASLTLGPTDAVMLVGGGAFKFLQQFYHFGVRSENYFDCSKLTRLSIEVAAMHKNQCLKTERLTLYSFGFERNKKNKYKNNSADK